MTRTVDRRPQASPAPPLGGTAGCAQRITDSRRRRLNGAARGVGGSSGLYNCSSGTHSPTDPLRQCRYAGSHRAGGVVGREGGRYRDPLPHTVAEHSPRSDHRVEDPLWDVTGTTSTTVSNGGRMFHHGEEAGHCSSSFSVKTGLLASASRSGPRRHRSVVGDTSNRQQVWSALGSYRWILWCPSSLVGRRRDMPPTRAPRGRRLATSRTAPELYVAQRPEAHAGPAQLVPYAKRTAHAPGTGPHALSFPVPLLWCRRSVDRGSRRRQHCTSSTWPRILLPVTFSPVAPRTPAGSRWRDSEPSARIETARDCAAARSHAPRLRPTHNANTTDSDALTGPAA